MSIRKLLLNRGMLKSCTFTSGTFIFNETEDEALLAALDEMTAEAPQLTATEEGLELSRIEDLTEDPEEVAGENPEETAGVHPMYGLRLFINLPEWCRGFVFKKTKNGKKTERNHLKNGFSIHFMLYS